MLDEEKEYVSHPLIKPQSIEARLYQQVIAAEAASKNTLAVLPTALGKTVIAILVAAISLSQHPASKVLILAPTRPLVLQHRDSFEKFMNVAENELVAITGRLPQATREKLWQRGKVFFATPQVVHNDIETEVLNLIDFSLLVVDEAHRSVGDYPYTTIAKHYIAQAKSPRILALTASPGGDKKRLEEVCKTLYIEKIVYRNEHDPDVAPYIPGTRVTWKLVDLPQQYLKAERVLKEMLRKRLEKLKSKGLVDKPVQKITKSDLLDIGRRLQNSIQYARNRYERSTLFSKIVLQSAALSLCHALEVLQTQGAEQAISFLEKIASESEAKRSYSEVVEDELFPYLMATLRHTARYAEHPKLGAVTEVVRNHLKGKPGSRVLVFTQLRETALKIAEKLRKEGINCERFIGQADRGGIKGMTQEKQREVIQRFREGDFNVLVATSIAEEGLDIPSVDLVVFYEPVPSEIRLIQRRGRTGRKAPGRVVILATQGTPDIGYLYSSRKKEREMRRMLEELNAELRPLQRKPQNQEIFTGGKKKLLFSSTGGLKNAVQRCLEEWVPDDEVHGVGKVERRVLEILGEKRRIKVEELIDYLKREKLATTDQVKAAIHNLLLKKEIYIPVAGEIALPEAEGRGVFKVVVKRVYPGGATLEVNGKFRARLDVQDFPEAAGKLKRGAELLIKGRLYRYRGILHLRPHELLP